MYASSGIDLFDEATLADPYPAYARLRELGSVVRLEAHGVWALPRHASVATALRDPATYSSERALALTDPVNERLLAGTVVGTDGAAHARLRRVLSRQLAPRALKSLTLDLHEHARALVEALPHDGGFDAVADLAAPFVAGIVMRLMGLPDRDRALLLDLADATFDTFGPDNARTRAGLPHAEEMFGYLARVATRDTIAADSWLGAIHTAADHGDIDESQAVPLMLSYTVAGMDTTIHAITSALHLLAHTDQWAPIRDRAVPTDAVLAEALRMEAPIQFFGRRTTRDVHIGDTVVPAGEQVLLLYGSAGRDRDRWGPDADTFDITRDSRDHLALGSGIHQCAGNHLATLEFDAVLTALARRFRSLAPSPGQAPTRRPHNILRGWHTLPLVAA
ncbi:cytochrome P450 [Embleya scabrispora]|uniref:cytochrome P450 n=1 Tax=Embleya scabrispora TaxID=159449 RepID=UPI00036142B9|nr:cytochrome P450 [Embleya scabrispora]